MPFKDSVETAKSIFELVRGIFVTAILIFVISICSFWPETMWSALKRFHVTEFDLLGLKGSVSETVVAVSTQVKDLQVQNDRLRQRVTDTQDALKSVTSNPPINLVASRIAQIFSENDKALATADSSSKEASKVLSSNESAISAAQTVVGDAGLGWVVLFGSDPSDASARDELKKAQVQFPTARIYYNHSRYRSAVWFSSSAEAKDALAKVQISGHTLRALTS